MPEIVDFFNSDSFHVVAMTTAINKIPNTYGKIRELGLFPTEGVTQRTIIVEEQNGVLNLLPTRAPGAPGTVGISGKRKVRSFVIPHIPHDDAVLPEEVQGVRVFGSDNMTEAVAAKVAQKLAAMRAKHAITLEHLRMGALKGIILDADGSTLYNLYTEFDITAKAVDFVLGTSTTEVREKCAEVLRHIEDNLKGEVMSRVHCLVSAEFYDKLVKHATVKEAYKYYKQTQNLSGDFRSAFEFGNIMFEEYRGSATDADGNTRRFIASGEGHAFPVGTSNTFRTMFAPADFNETANTIGIELYAKQEPRKFNRGVDIHTQSNPLPICKRPEILVKVHSSN
jgi:hypothetical protein